MARKVLCTLFLLLFLMSAVSATDVDDLNSTLTTADVSTLAVDDVDVPDIVNSTVKTFNITQDNIDDYFINGTIGSNYSNAVLNITEDISFKDILTVNAFNVTINGNNHSFYETVFNVGADYVKIKDLNLYETLEFHDNEGAAILIRADNVDVLNVYIDYIVPRDVGAYAIYSYATKRNMNNNLSIVNCTINFEGNNRKEKVYDYAVGLIYSPNAVFANNTIVSKLPLRNVDFVGTTAVLESEYALTVGVSNCDNLTFSGNNITASVNYRPGSSFPTLDCIFLADSKYVNFTKNSIDFTDYVTLNDINNYLYAFDGYRTDNLTIEANNIHVSTTGGMYAAGTAYPIQLTGPASGITILNNDLYSISNGPNIGIYSQNFNGGTYLTIMHNRINVTGYAGNHSWALVAGIEAQDNRDIIVNNTIEVHSIYEVAEDSNLYGIAYSQSTKSSHTYQVLNNTIFSDGYYFAYMLDAVNTVVANNTLVRFNKYEDTNYDPFKRGDSIPNDTDERKNNIFTDNSVITIFEYNVQRQNNTVDGGSPFNYTTPTNTGNISNNVDGSGINPFRPGFPDRNPLIPGNSGGDGSVIYTPDSKGGVITPLTPDVSDGDPNFVKPDLSGDDGQSLSKRTNGTINDGGNSQQTGSRLLDALLDYFESNTNDGEARSESYNGVRTNSTSSTSSPSIEGVITSASSSKSSTSSSSDGDVGESGAGGEAGGATNSKKAYEVSKDILDEDAKPAFVFVGLVIVMGVLLLVGYRRGKKNKDEY